MNLGLLNPLAQEYPEKITRTLDSQAAVTQFSPHGQLLAVGRGDGYAEIWDLHAYSPIRQLDGHVKDIVSVAWSRNSRYVLTASKDWTCGIWDLLPTLPATGCRRDTIRFETELSCAVFHPHTSRMVLATLKTNECVLVDLRKPKREQQWRLFDPDEEYYVKSTGIASARFTPDGKHVWAGTASGGIMIFDVASRQIIVSTQLDTRSAIRRMEIHPSGRYFAAIFADRHVRVYAVLLPDFSEQHMAATPEATSQDPAGAVGATDGEQENDDEEVQEIGITLIHAYSDQVQRCSWIGLAWSPDGECVIAGSGDKASHKIFIWYCISRQGLAKILEDRGQAVEDVTWHPQLPIIASVASSGRINIWSSQRVENWSAFAPGFEELEENVEYEEREDEFDIEDESEIMRRKRAVEDVDVDIGGTPPPPKKRHLPRADPEATVDEEFESDSDTDADFFPPTRMEDLDGDTL